MPCRLPGKEQDVLNNLARTFSTRVRSYPDRYIFLSGTGRYNQNRLGFSAIFDLGSLCFHAFKGSAASTSYSPPAIREHISLL